MASNEPDLKLRGKSKSMSTLEKCYENIGQPYPGIMTSLPSIGLPFHESIFCAGASPVKTSALRASEPGSTANGQGCGVNTSEPFAHFDPATSSWRTSQVCLLTNTWDEFSETWLRAGTMRNGIVYQQVPLAPLTGEIGSGLWPTPRADSHGSRPNGKGGKILNEEVMIAAGLRMRGEKLTPTLRSVQWENVRWSLRENYQGNLEEWGGKQFPDIIGMHMSLDWLEWLMGYPDGWTDCEDSATP